MFQENKKHAKAWKKLEKLVKTQDYDKINQKIVKKFTKHPSLGMSLYYRMCEAVSNVKIENPQLKIESVKSAITKLKLLEIRPSD